MEQHDFSTCYLEGLEVPRFSIFCFQHYEQATALCKPPFPPSYPSSLLFSELDWLITQLPISSKPIFLASVGKCSNTCTEVAYLITFGIPLLALWCLQIQKTARRGKTGTQMTYRRGSLWRSQMCAHPQKAPESSPSLLEFQTLTQGNPPPTLPCPALPWWFPRYTTDPKNQTLTMKKLDDEDQTLTRNKLEDEEEEEDNKP